MSGGTYTVLHFLSEGIGYLILKVETQYLL